MREVASDNRELIIINTYEEPNNSKEATPEKCSFPDELEGMTSVSLTT